MRSEFRYPSEMGKDIYDPNLNKPFFFYRHPKWNLGYEGNHHLSEDRLDKMAKHWNPTEDVYNIRYMLNPSSEIQLHYVSIIPFSIAHIKNPSDKIIMTAMLREPRILNVIPPLYVHAKETMLEANIKCWNCFDEKSEKMQWIYDDYQRRHPIQTYFKDYVESFAKEENEDET